MYIETTLPSIIVDNFDKLSNEICTVADWADCLRSLHPDKKIKDAAYKAVSLLGNIVHFLNTDKTLYFVLKSCYEEIKKNDFNENLDQELIMMIKSLLYEFENHGILLNDNERKRFLNFEEECDILCYQYTQGCINNLQLIENKEKTSNNYNQHQLELLKNLLNCRYETAKCLGKHSYADWIVSQSMAGSVEEVNNFLKLTKENLLKKCSIINFKNDFNITKFLNIKNQIWNDLKKFYFDMSYFIDFYCEFLKSMYDIELVVNCDNNIEVWNNEIICLKVKKYNNKTQLFSDTIGYIYLDFFPNKNKSDVACHFTLFGRKKYTNNQNEQLPRVFLSLTISPKYQSNKYIINLENVSEFMHEMGHALHSVLYNGKYQHLSGTRCSTDISEIPSTFMECFLTHPQFFFKSQNNLNIDFCQTLCEKIQLHKNFSTLEHLITATIDLNIHNSTCLYNDSTEILKSFYSTYNQFNNNFKIQNNNSLNYFNNLQYFQHFGSYGAKYYSYIWSQSCADLIFQHNFLNNVFDKKSHQKVEKYLFSKGAIITGNEIMSNLCYKNV